MRVFFFLYICVLFTACEKVVYYELNKADRIMLSSPDSSLIILENLKTEYSHMDEANKAYFGILYFQALDRNGLSFDDSSQLEFSFRYYEQVKEKRYLAYCYLYKAKTFLSARNYVKATENLLKAKDLASACDDAGLSGRIFFFLARISSYQLHYEQSIDYYKKSLDNYEKIKDNNSIAKVYIMLNEVYMCLYKFETGIEYGKRALECAPDSVLQGDAYNSIGITYYFFGGHVDDYAYLDSARYYIGKSLDYPYYGTNKSMRTYNMGRTCYTSKDRDSAEFYLNKALEYPIDIYFEEEVYTLLMKIAVEKKETDKIKPYMAKVKICQDSLYKLEQQTDIKVVEQIHETHKQTDEIWYHRLILFIGAIVLLLIGLAIIYILHQRAKQRRMIAEKYKVRMEEKHKLLIKKNEQLGEIRKTQINEINAEIQSVYIKYAEERRVAGFEKRERITRMIYNEVLSLEDENTFIEKMNQRLNNFPDKLLEKYPNITFKEILWCCLFILKVPTPDVLSILEYRQSSFYKFKQRLGNKLGYAIMKDLEEMLHREARS